MTPEIILKHEHSGIIDVDFKPAITTWRFTAENEKQFVYVLTATAKPYCGSLVNEHVLQQLKQDISHLLKTWIDNGSIIILPSTLNLTGWWRANYSNATCSSIWFNESI